VKVPELTAASQASVPWRSSSHGRGTRPGTRTTSSSIVDLYAEDVELTSPLVSALSGRADAGSFSANGRLAAEVIYLDGQGKISRYGAHYASRSTT
jgi:hypothetical protein